MKSRHVKGKDTPLGIGSKVEEFGGRGGRNHLGEIFGIIDGRRGKSFDLILLNPHDLCPVTKGALGTYRRFKLPEQRASNLTKTSSQRSVLSRLATSSGSPMALSFAMVSS